MKAFRKRLSSVMVVLGLYADSSGFIRFSMEAHLASAEP